MTMVKRVRSQAIQVMTDESLSPDEGGFANVFKPIGLRSTQVVGRVRRATGFRRVGHCGTLDPLAWGVLPIALGRATRLSRYVLDMRKTYEVVVIFGVETDSNDLEGKPIGLLQASPSIEAVHDLLPEFVGTIEQRPPDFSAVRVDGVRAYREARAGRRPKLRSKRVDVFALDLVAAGRVAVSVIDGRLRFMEGRGTIDALVVGLRIECSSGTYVRALARDLGDVLGCGAAVFGLIRTSVGPFGLAAATEIWQLSLAAHEGFLKALLYEPDIAVEHLPTVILSDRACFDFSYGRSIARTGESVGIHRLYNGNGCFVGMATGASDRWIPELVWCPKG